MIRLVVLCLLLLVLSSCGQPVTAQKQTPEKTASETVEVFRTYGFALSPGEPKEQLLVKSIREDKQGKVIALVSLHEGEWGKMLTLMHIKEDMQILTVYYYQKDHYLFVTTNKEGETVAECIYTPQQKTSEKPCDKQTIDYIKQAKRETMDTILDYLGLSWQDLCLATDYIKEWYDDTGVIPQE